jgi:hypothetical protein
MDNGHGRTLNRQSLRAVLNELAAIDAAAFSLHLSLEPLTEEEKAGGAEALTPAQIQEDLTAIRRKVEQIALLHLGADPAEWRAALESIA